MIIYVDIDGTICTDEKGLYDKAKPINEQIHKINKLYDENNTIVYWTARGTVTGINWYNLTKQQLEHWGCKYHKLKVGTKPHYDLWVDDKSKRIEEI
jgi:histidinol phosphatase-like enzyme